jgi:hypothetical protein
VPAPIRPATRSTPCTRSSVRRAATTASFTPRPLT